MKLTNKDFEIFKKECEFWLDYFHLRDYKVTYEFTNIDNAFANCASDSIGRQAIISLNSDDYEFDVDLEMSAFHEVCELMLGDIYAMLADYYSPSACQQQTHYIIRKLENSVYKSEIARRDEGLKLQEIINGIDMRGH